MKAKTIKGFLKMIRGKERPVKVGELLDVIKDSPDDSGEIRLDGDYLCDVEGPFAKEHFVLLDELELVELPKPTEEPDRIGRLKREGYTNLPYDDVQWLVQQAEKAREHEEWLEKIADIDQDTLTATDAAYWALLALGRA